MRFDPYAVLQEIRSTAAKPAKAAKVGAGLASLATLAGGYVRSEETDVPQIRATAANRLTTSTLTPGPVSTFWPEAHPAPSDGGSQEVALVSVPPHRPKTHGRSLVGLDGATVCGKCGHRTHIPHHLSLVFWQFWRRNQLAALAEKMAPDEHLQWIGHGLARVGANGVERTVRFTDGHWSADESERE